MDDQASGSSGLSSLTPEGIAQGTVTVSNADWTATMATMRRLEERLNERDVRDQLSSACTPRHRSTSGHRTYLKPKMPDLYYGESHSELYEFIRQCMEYFVVAQADVDDPESIAFAASCVRGKTAGPTWSAYQKSRPHYLGRV